MIKIDLFTAFGLACFAVLAACYLAVAVRIAIAALERSHVPADDLAKGGVAPRYVITPVYGDVICNQDGMFQLNERHEWVSVDDGYIARRDKAA